MTQKKKYLLMFEEILKSYAAEMSSFEELAQDDFGRSIVADIYEPLMAEVSMMMELNNRNEEQRSAFQSLLDERN